MTKQYSEMLQERIWLHIVNVYPLFIKLFILITTPCRDNSIYYVYLSIYVAYTINKLLYFNTSFPTFHLQVSGHFLFVNTKNNVHVFNIPSTIYHLFHWACSIFRVK